MPLLNVKSFPSAIGFAVYSYEGIGIVLPVQNVTANKEQYPKVVVGVVVFIVTLYVFFGLFAISIWG